MNDLCGWSEEALSNRHPRYRALFSRRDRSRSTTSTPMSQVEKEEDVNQEKAEDMQKSRQEGQSDSRAIPIRSRGQSSPPPPLPAAPQPSADVVIHEVNAKVLQEQEERAASIKEEALNEPVDILAMRPLQALELLTMYIQILVQSPETPLPKPPTPPSSGGSSATPSPAQTPGSTSERQPAAQEPAGLAPPTVTLASPGPTSPQHPFLQRVPRASRTPIDSPISHPQSPIPTLHPTSPLPLDKTTHIIAQSDKLARKFYCKSAPPVPIPEYLQRLHKFCPMSVAVYLAAGIYIERLTRKRASADSYFAPLTPVSSNSKPAGPSTTSLLEKAGSPRSPSEDSSLVEVTPKSVHRLLLAALRVANKALEDGVFPHRRVALVGGVSELELSRLEVSMCFLTDFELILKVRDMERWVRRIKALALKSTLASIPAAEDAQGRNAM